MQEMSNYMQVFTITHLPQIAAKGDYHFKVFKTEKNNTTITQLKPLNSEERLEEIAQMLGGLNLTASAKAHAKRLVATICCSCNCVWFHTKCFSKIMHLLDWG